MDITLVGPTRPGRPREKERLIHRWKLADVDRYACRCRSASIQKRRPNLRRLSHPSQSIPCPAGCGIIRVYAERWIDDKVELKAMYMFPLFCCHNIALLIPSSSSSQEVAGLSGYASDATIDHRMSEILHGSLIPYLLLDRSGDVDSRHPHRHLIYVSL